MQTNSARGAASSQLGPNIHALLTLLNKELGLSHGKSVKLLRTLFPELGAQAQSMLMSVIRTSLQRGRDAFNDLLQLICPPAPQLQTA